MTLVASSLLCDRIVHFDAKIINTMSSNLWFLSTKFSLYSLQIQIERKKQQHLYI